MKNKKVVDVCVDIIKKYMNQLSYSIENPDNVQITNDIDVVDCHLRQKIEDNKIYICDDIYDINECLKYLIEELYRYKCKDEFNDSFKVITNNIKTEKDMIKFLEMYKEFKSVNPKSRFEIEVETLQKEIVNFYTNDFLKVS